MGTTSSTDRRPRGASAKATVSQGRASPQWRYAIGEIYLAALPDLHEVEIEDVLPAARAIKLKGFGWIEDQAFDRAVKAKIGRAVYSHGLLSLQRKFIRES